MKFSTKIKQLFPWWIKIILKIIYSHIPLNNFFKTILFKHGDMLNHSYVFDIFTKHIRNAGCKPDWFTNRVLLELGPGDSLFSSVLAKAYSASGSFMVDTGSYANTDLKNYLYMIDYIKKMGLKFPQINHINNVNELLHFINAKYLTSGLTSLKKLEKQSVDFIWSEAVLEHIRLSEFYPTLIELKRILKNDGICSMTVDLRDHLQNGLNNLRFNRKLWESEFFANSGFYTNRIGFTKMIKLFEKAGFKVKANIFRRWDTLPIKRKRLDREFRDINNNELMISGFSLLITHK